MNFEATYIQDPNMKQSYDQNNNQIDANGTTHHSNVNAVTNR